jgi:hypothetical protein
MHSRFPPINDLYEASLEELNSAVQGDDPLLPAIAWIRAENMRDVYYIVRRWAMMIEKGLVADHFLQLIPGAPDSSCSQMDQKYYDRLVLDFIKNLANDEYFSPYFNQILNLPTMPANVRSAFAREILTCFKSMDAIRTEARNRTSSGESFPP